VKQYISTVTRGLPVNAVINFILKEAMYYDCLTDKLKLFSYYGTKLNCRILTVKFKKFLVVVVVVQTNLSNLSSCSFVNSFLLLSEAILDSWWVGLLGWLASATPT
jgi:hypothetical protein